MRKKKKGVVERWKKRVEREESRERTKEAVWKKPVILAKFQVFVFPYGCKTETKDSNNVMKKVWTYVF